MPISGPDILRYEKKGRIAVITINRQERMNAVSPELSQRLNDTWLRFDEDEDAWVAILTGAGDRAFCAGMDLLEFAAAAKATGAKGPRPGAPPVGSRWSPVQLGVWKPIIAAINGYAIAGGAFLAMDCDIRIAAEHAEIGVGEARWNMSAAWVGPLTNHMSLGHALELVLWADKRFSAQKCYEIGFVNKVVPKEKLMDEAMAWADRVLYMGPRMVRNTKQILYRATRQTWEESWAFASSIDQNLAAMEDTIEGPKAFAEKRPPQFKNR